MKLVPTLRCPVCRGEKRSLAQGGMAANRKDAGINYLKHAARKLGLEPAQLGEAVKIYSCGDCAATYCDPWLDGETASYVFTAGAPDHIAGWANFEHWLSSERLNGEQETNARLYAVLEKRLGAINSYAEFGCPFQGFLLMFKGREETTAGRQKLFARALNRPSDVRWTASARLHHAAARAANALVLAYHKIRRLKEGGAHRPGAAPKVRRLLTQETIRAWSNNCVRYGGSCRYFAGGVLSADVLPFQTTEESYDLLGIFNSLDHTDAPVEVLRRALTLAKHVVVVTHHATQAGKQHQYAFDESFPAWLEKNIEGAVAHDLTREILGEGRRDNNYILISRKHG